MDLEARLFDESDVLNRDNASTAGVVLVDPQHTQNWMAPDITLKEMSATMRDTFGEVYPYFPSYLHNKIFIAHRGHTH